LKLYSEENELKQIYGNDSEEENLSFAFDNNSNLNDEEQSQLGASGAFKVILFLFGCDLFEIFLFFCFIMIYFGFVYTDQIKNLILGMHKI
jgi:hypothetical protein